MNGSVLVAISAFIETSDSFTIGVAFDFDDCGNELWLKSHETQEGRCKQENDEIQFTS